MTTELTLDEFIQEISINASQTSALFFGGNDITPVLNIKEISEDRVVLNKVPRFQILQSTDAMSCYLDRMHQRESIPSLADICKCQQYTFFSMGMCYRADSKDCFTESDAYGAHFPSARSICPFLPDCPRRQGKRYYFLAGDNWLAFQACSTGCFG